MDAEAALEGAVAVLGGDVPEFTMDYPCHSPSESRWFRMDVTPLDPGRRSGFLVSHMDITPIKTQQSVLKDIAASVQAALNDIGFDTRPARPAYRHGDLPMLLGDAVVEAHHLAAKMLEFVKRQDFCAKDATEFTATLINEWARAVGTDLFNGKNLFDGEGSA